MSRVGLPVIVVDAEGDQITDFGGTGGGTQYTEDAAAAANPIGTALILVREDALGGSLTTTDGDNVAARGNNKGEQYVKDTDTATAMTAANASLDAIEASASVLDDWDESDRAKVNLIVGQVGVAAGAGTVGATVQRVTLASDDPALVNTEYETVAASQTAQALGATGATGDYITGILVVPATTSPGQVLLLDNATSITVFVGGASSVTTLIPFFIPLGIKSVSGAWKITTGANVSCIGVGNFTA